MEIMKKLFDVKDEKYGDFTGKLIPNIDRNKIIGVRVPILRKIAKSYIKDKESKEFLQGLPHKYFDENMLHGIIISQTKEFDICMKQVEEFLPHIDNWAVCDIISPKIFKENKDELLMGIKKWIKSKETYICRFGIGMLMMHYLDDEFKEEYLDMVTRIKSKEYYVNMMIAWFFATALAKQWEITVPYIENNRLEKWTNNKTIQKARESYRITKDQKEYLKNFKMK